MSPTFLQSARRSLALFCIAALLLPATTQAATSGVLAPTASFTASATTAPLRQVLTFDASKSVDAWGSNQLEYRWDFNSSFRWTPWSNSPRTSASFGEGGEYVVRLQVRDRAGSLDETKTLIRIQALGVGAPMGQFSATPTSGTTDTNFQFLITNLVSQIGTQVQDLEVRWDWEGDGVWDTEWSRSRLFFHVFPTGGMKEVHLQMRDTNGLTGLEKGFYVTGKENDQFREKEIGRVEVKEVGMPQASLRTWPVTGGVGTIVHFDAAGSLRAQAYRFDWEGDGVWDTAWGGSITEHRYTEPGVFHPVVEARSAGQGWSDTTTRTVTITDDRDPLAPVAKLTARNLTHTLKTSGAYTVLGVLQDEIAFSASGSTDPDGSSAALLVRWDFDGDGRWDTPFATGKEARHRYTVADTYRPMVEVLDADGYRVRTSVTLKIVQNTAPTARLTVRDQLGTRKTTFWLDASSTTDDQSDTSQLSARFDFEGDGRWDTPFATGKTVSHVYTDARRYHPAVQVRDYAGLLATATAELEVVDPTPPVATFTTTPLVGTFATTFKFDAGKSSDPSGVGGPFSYRWDFHASDASDVQYDTSWRQTPTASIAYTTTGWHGVRLAVRNSQGDTTEVTQKIFVHPASPYMALLARRAALTDANPDALLTRAELAKMLVKMAEGRSGPRPVAGQFFTDVPGQTWFAPFAATAVQRGWLATRANFAFQPAAKVTRAELARAAIAALYPRVAVAASGPTFHTPFADLTASSPDLRFATVVKDEGLLPNAGATFEPTRPVTRAEAAVMLGKLAEKYNGTRVYAAFATSWAQQLTASLLTFIR